MSTFHSRDEILETTAQNYAGTILEGIEEVYEEHPDLLEFMVKSGESITPDAFLGSEAALIEEGMEIDEDELEAQLRAHDSVGPADSIIFMSDLMRYIADRLEAECETTEEAITAFGDAIVQSVDVQDDHAQQVVEQKREEAEADLRDLTNDYLDSDNSGELFELLGPSESEIAGEFALVEAIRELAAFADMMVAFMEFDLEEDDGPAT